MITVMVSLLFMTSFSLIQ